MNVKIGEKIKLLRKTANCTQEKLAEYLGITPQAVSKWESESAYPDLEMLTPLANFFAVSTDELLCHDESKNQEKINKILLKRNYYDRKGMIKEKFDLLKEAVKEFPNDWGILSSYAYAVWEKSKKLTDENERNAGLNEARKIYERIVVDCPDELIKYTDFLYLAKIYKSLGEIEKANALADRLPAITGRELRQILADGEEWRRLTRRMIMHDTENLCRLIFRYGSKNENATERIAFLEKAIAIYDIIFECGDYGFYHERLGNYRLEMSAVYLELGECKLALDCLEKCAEYYIIFDTRCISEHTSICFIGETDDPENSGSDDTSNSCWHALSDLLGERFASVKDEPRFVAVCERLRKYARE